MSLRAPTPLHVPFPFRTVISRVQFPKLRGCHCVGSCKQVYLILTRWTWWRLTIGSLCRKGFHSFVQPCYHSLSATSSYCALAAAAGSVEEVLRDSLSACLSFLQIFSLPGQYDLFSYTATLRNVLTYLSSSTNSLWFTSLLPCHQITILGIEVCSWSSPQIVPKITFFRMKHCTICASECIIIVYDFIVCPMPFHRQQEQQ